jgi:hypothetical protein
MHIAFLQTKRTRMLVRLNAPDILFGKYLSWIEDFSQGSFVSHSDYIW